VFRRSVALPSPRLVVQVWCSAPRWSCRRPPPRRRLFATLGELALGPGTVGVLGRYAAQVTLGRFALRGAGRTDSFLAQLPRDGSAAARKRR
jgi:hypothetical protein